MHKVSMVDQLQLIHRHKLMLVIFASRLLNQLILLTTSISLEETLIVLQANQFNNKIYQSIAKNHHLLDNFCKKSLNKIKQSQTNKFNLIQLLTDLNPSINSLNRIFLSNNFSSINNQLQMLLIYQCKA